MVSKDMATKMVFYCKQTVFIFYRIGDLFNKQIVMNLYEIDKSAFAVTLNEREKANTFVYGEDENKAVIKFLEQSENQIFGITVKFICKEKDIIK